jgi:hypothetical protein
MRDACFSKGGAAANGPNLGRCSCAEALAGADSCGYVTREARAFCLNPTQVAAISANEDGRIGRRVK